MTCPVTTSQLRNQDKVPCRMYSNARRSTWPGCMGKSGCLRVFRLHASQLIQADRALSLFGSFSSGRIHLASLHNFLVALFIRYLGQPVAEPVGLEPLFLSKRAACRGEICSTMPRAFNSSAISLPVHWLIGRPALAGASHPSAAM